MEKRIEELRAEGYTWWQIDQLLFPDQVSKFESNNGKSPSYKFAKKKNLNAFTKRVYGIYTPTQIVQKIELKPKAQTLDTRTPDPERSLVGIFG